MLVAHSAYTGSAAPLGLHSHTPGLAPITVSYSASAYQAGQSQPQLLGVPRFPSLPGVFCISPRKPAFQTSGVRLPLRKANLSKARWLPNLRINGSGLGISPIWRRSYLSEEGEYRSHLLPESESEQHVINPGENNVEDSGMMVFGAICIKPKNEALRPSWA